MMDKQHEALLPCPFCGSDCVELSNTHTPSFWVGCKDCGAEVNGQYFPSRRKRVTKFSYTATTPTSPFESNYAGLHVEYRKAADSAIAAWNRRTAATKDKP